MPKKTTDDDDDDVKTDDTGSGEGNGELRRALREERAARREAEKQLGILRTSSASSKSEMETLTAKIDQMDKRAKEAELRAARLEIAQEKGLTAAQARRLRGDSPEELREDADDMIEAFGIKPGKKKDDEGKSDDKDDTDTSGSDKESGGKPEENGKKVAPNRFTQTPKAKLTSGASNGSEGEKTFDPDKTADEILRDIRGG